MRLGHLGLRAIEEPRFAWRLVLGICALYVAGFALFTPRAILIEDEVHYKIQARMLAAGETEITRVNPYTGTVKTYAPRYPLGTALLMAPLMAALGEPAIHLVPLGLLILAVVALGRWLEVAGRSPLFALLVLGYPPSLVLGRTLMSDVPSLAIVAVGLLCFWRGIDRGPGWWLAAGFLAGASFSIRETNALVFAPFFAGSLLRRDRNAWALVISGLLGLTIRAVSDLTFHDVLYFSRGNYALEFETLYKRLPVYLVAMFVFVPFGLALALCYRGPRRPELCTTIVLLVAVYLFQQHYSFATSSLKRSILAPRYLLPILPVIAFGMAESIPRLWNQFLVRRSVANHQRLRTWAPRLVGAWAGGIAIAAFAVHPALAWWGSTQAAIGDMIQEHAEGDTVIVTNYSATRKFIDGLDRKYLPVPTMDRNPMDISLLAAIHGEITLIFLARSDSPYWLGNAGRNESFIAAIQGEKNVILDRKLDPRFHLKIWRIRPHREERP